MPTGPTPSVTKVMVRAVPEALLAASSIRLLKVASAIGALAGAVGFAVADGTAVALAVALAEAEGPDDSEESLPEGTALVCPISDELGAGDPLLVASRAPAAMMRITQATPRIADRLRQLVSFTWFTPPFLELRPTRRVTRYPLRARQR
jgi:hypothetical protein